MASKKVCDKCNEVEIVRFVQILSGRKKFCGELCELCFQGLIDGVLPVFGVKEVLGGNHEINGRGYP